MREIVCDPAEHEVVECLLAGSCSAVFLSFTAYCDRFVYYMFGSVTKTCAGTMHTISVIVENAHVEDGRLSEPRYIANLGECVNSGNIFVLFCLLL